MLIHFFHVEGLATAVAVLGFGWGVVRWLYRGVVAFQAATKFVEDMGTNHLPHIYERLGQIDYRLGIEPKQPPSIRFPGD